MPNGLCLEGAIANYGALGLMSENKPRSLVLFRFLAFAHGIAGLVLLLFYVFFIGAVFVNGGWVMPARGISFIGMLGIAVQMLMPLALGAWFLVLAFRLWRPAPPLAAQLRWTHWIFLLFGGLFCAWGFFAIEAAERSTAAGGGLLSPLAVMPFFVGAPLIALALVSLFAAQRIASGR